jgi:hypothetical protein
MTWTKLGDEFPAEARDLTSDEFRLHVEALCWSNKRLLDLHVPKHDLKRFSELDKPEEASYGLGAKGWWEDCGDTWYIGVRFSEWQVERVVEERRQQNNSLRQRRHRLHKAGDHSLCLPSGPCPYAPESLVTRYAARLVTRYETRRPGRDGTGPTAPAAPQGQPPGQDQEQPIANSHKPRVHDGPESLADDAHRIPDATIHRTPATDRNAREAEPGPPPVPRECELTDCLTPQKPLPDGSRYHLGCGAIARRAERDRAEAVATWPRPGGTTRSPVPSGTMPPPLPRSTRSCRCWPATR